MTKYNHRLNIQTAPILREVVFGVEDGMVSTLGAITGIAIGSQDYYMILLSGAVIIAVESISMGIGSYLANQSEQEANSRKLVEEKIELSEYPEEEKTELFRMFLRDGWSKNLSRQMIDEASRNKELMFKEMVYRELEISTGELTSPLKKGLYMFFSYILGGLVPLFAYIVVLPVALAMKVSMAVTLAGLFGLGAATTRYTKGSWWRTGLRLLVLGGVALFVGVWIGKIAILISK